MEQPSAVHRLFIAVRIDETIADGINHLIHQLAATGHAVKWVKPKNLHFTLKFLGDVEHRNIEPLKDALRAIDLPPFTLKLSGIGMLPSQRHPRVIFVDAVQGAAELSALAERVERLLQPLGYAREARRFVPHLTIGRVKEGRLPPELAEKIAGAQNTSFGKLSVDRVYLVESDLQPHGPVYTDVELIPLK